ncbi:uvr/rep helicase [Gigaspora margarita]|uniref:Uvr/rep helicase n=1 Tax=Gigaspora margarita TaxID=4874 RepID=A0A8H3WZS8_GIGMA|nr:uvr/rep helicase [Gigaspora margarita]
MEIAFQINTMIANKIGMDLVINNHIWKAVPSNVQQRSWSVLRRPDFLKTLEYPNGLELDIYYGFAFEVQGEQHENMSNSFIEAIPINLLNSKSGINSR